MINKKRERGRQDKTRGSKRRAFRTNTRLFLTFSLSTPPQERLCREDECHTHMGICESTLYFSLTALLIRTYYNKKYLKL